MGGTKIIKGENRRQTIEVASKKILDGFIEGHQIK